MALPQANGQDNLAADGTAGYHFELLDALLLLLAELFALAAELDLLAAFASLTAFARFFASALLTISENSLPFLNAFMTFFHVLTSSSTTHWPSLSRGPPP